MTAIDWFLNELLKNANFKWVDRIDIYEISKQAKELEKEQIIDAYCDGSNTRTSGEEYYKEAYENQKNSDVYFYSKEYIEYMKQKTRVEALIGLSSKSHSNTKNK